MVAMRLVPRALFGAACVACLGGCFFPEYTFDETSSGGGGASGVTTTTTSSTTTTASGGGGGGGGGPPAEDCLAPGDEDANGLADCADPACTPEVECVDPIPVGWGGLGYVALHRGSPSSDPPCPGGTAGEVYAGFDGLVADESCTPCECGAAIDQPCALDPADQDIVKSGLQQSRLRDVPCSVASASTLRTLTVPSPWDGSCYTFENWPGGGSCAGGPCNNSFEIPKPAKTATGGTCETNGGEASTATPSWSQSVKACDAIETLGGCTGGQTCVPKPKAPYNDHICIAKAGNLACPGAFTDRSISYGDYDDARGCTTCTCGAASGGTCKITMSLFVNNNCTGLVGSTQSGTCSDLTGNPGVASWSYAVTTPGNGTCNVTGGGSPTGGVTEANPTTFCCIPDP
jgi:hypothetical protein